MRFFGLDKHAAMEKPKPLASSTLQASLGAVRSVPQILSEFWPQDSKSGMRVAQRLRKPPHAASPPSQALLLKTELPLGRASLSLEHLQLGLQIPPPQLLLSKLSARVVSFNIPNIAVL